MAGLLARLRNRFSPPEEKQYIVDPMGSISSRPPASWPWNWWQLGWNNESTGGTAVVHASVDAYAQTIASVPAYHWRYDEKGSREKITTTALSRVLLRPNEYQTRSDFFLNVVKTLLFNGNAYVLGFRNDRNEITEIHQLHSRSTQPYIDPETRQVFYAAGDNPLIDRPAAEDLKWMIPARDMCHIRLYCPRHPLIGVSPIENAIESIMANSAISSQQSRFFSNMSRPSGVLSTDMKLTKDQMLQLRSAWEEQSKDMNTGGIPILGSGIKWEPMAISNNDAKLVEAFNMTVEDVARAFRVPLPLVNDNRHSTYNNIEQLIAHWLSGGLGFMLDHVENALDRFFGLNPAQQRIEFDVDVLLRTDFQGRIEGYTKAIQNALMTPNEARSRFGGLPEVENGDKPIVQQQMVSLGWTENQGMAAPVTPPPDEDTELAANVYFLKKAMNDG